MVNKVKLPTGFLFSADYSKGVLETLSIGDYGKEHNVKADFLGLTREINGVANGPVKPMSEKWVVTLSTQYGCSMDCTFCDCPKIRYGGNASVADLWNQLALALECFPDVKYAERLNIHFARMGEPAFNSENVLFFARDLQNQKELLQKESGIRFETIHPVFTTSMPAAIKDEKLEQILVEWCELKNYTYNGQAGLQLSINSTSDDQRHEMFAGKAKTLDKIAEICEKLPNPVGRKYCLNFAYATGFEVDANRLVELFDPERFMVKITPIHNNDACREVGIETIDGYNSYAPYRDVEERLKSVGFDVLVFIPSQDEEDGLITCGNLALSKDL